MNDLIMRKATINDYDAYYRIKCDPKNVEWSGFLTPPNYIKLKSRFNAFFDCERQHLFLFESHDIVIGYLNLHILDDGLCIETSHGAISRHNIKSLGSKMLNSVIQYIERDNTFFQARYMIGWVAESNIASIQNVLKNRYKSTDEVEYRQINGNNEKFVKYKRRIGVNE